MSSVADRAKTLRSLVRLLTEASEVVIKEWEAAEQAQTDANYLDGSSVPSLPLYNARRTIVGVCGMSTDLVQEPQSRLMEVAVGYVSARALHIAAEARLADILSNADATSGIHLRDISQQTGINPQKLGSITF